MKNNKDTNKSKFSFSELVRDNRFLAVLSFIIAFSTMNCQKNKGTFLKKIIDCLKK